jgi:hypothetical protein
VKHYDYIFYKGQDAPLLMTVLNGISVCLISVAVKGNQIIIKRMTEHGIVSWTTTDSIGKKSF